MAGSSTAERPCLYAVLGVAKGASAADIGAAYHKMVQEWELEGDSSTTAESRASFLRMKEAYEVLSDASRRAMYDAGVVFPPAPDFQLSNFLFPSVNRLLAEMEGLRSRVSKFNERMKKDPTLTMDQMLVMLNDINKPDDPPQAPAPKRRGRPPKYNGVRARPAPAPGGAAGVRKKKQPAAARKPPRGKKGVGSLAHSPSPHGGTKKKPPPPPPGFNGPCACVMKSLRIRAQNC
ncbi:unnamed protein product [Urochloa decumbens]|uniref:J domain-containing protein n=1 Tax=Urochloa decumbens TaxID=240449 RepID=A0ABC9DL62_9POAL